MQKFLFYLFILLLATFIGLTLAHTPAFVLFQLKDWSIVFPLWLFIVLVAVLIYLTLIARRITKALFIAPQKLKSTLTKMQQRHDVRRQLRKIKKQIGNTQT
jgi:uncharacterized protein HemY